MCMKNVSLHLHGVLEDTALERSEITLVPQFMNFLCFMILGTMAAFVFLLGSWSQLCSASDTEFPKGSKTLLNTSVCELFTNNIHELNISAYHLDQMRNTKKGHSFNQFPQQIFLGSLCLHIAIGIRIENQLKIREKRILKELTY